MSLCIMYYIYVLILNKIISAYTHIYISLHMHERRIVRDEENPVRLCKSAHGAAPIYRCENKSLDHAQHVEAVGHRHDSTELAEKKNVRNSTCELPDT